MKVGTETRNKITGQRSVLTFKLWGYGRVTYLATFRDTYKGQEVASQRQVSHWVALALLEPCTAQKGLVLGDLP